MTDDARKVRRVKRRLKEAAGLLTRSMVWVLETSVQRNGHVFARKAHWRRTMIDDAKPSRTS